MSHQIGGRKQSKRNTGTEEGQRREMDSLTSGTEEGSHGESATAVESSIARPGGEELGSLPKRRWLRVYRRPLGYGIRGLTGPKRESGRI